MGTATAAHPEQEMQYIFRFSGQYWHVRFGAEAAFGFFTDTRGLRFIHRLLSRPKELISSSQLRIGGRPGLAGDADVAAHTDVGFNVNHDDSCGEMIDERYRADLERRCDEIRAQLASGSMGAAQRAEREADLHSILNSLGQATGLRGRARQLGTSTKQRAHHSVRRAIRRAYDQLSTPNRKLDQFVLHFDRSLRSGHCALRYDPEVSYAWQL